jgi:hypothetical protein
LFNLRKKGGINSNDYDVTVIFAPVKINALGVSQNCPDNNGHEHYGLSRFTAMQPIRACQISAGK